jgi:tRNA(Ile)-lysidine synthase
MLERFEEYWRSVGGDKKKVMAAVSGGVDSIVLLHLLLKTGTHVAVAHANFQLRGSASEADESWVCALADSWKVTCFTTRFETNNYASQHGISVQMAARDLRYAWFNELLEHEHFDALATGHHLNDNLETVLLNFTRGTGLRGLTGIPSSHGKIVRPLLDFTRSEIEAYAVENLLAWREDESNKTDDYDRNVIRHHVIPRLGMLNPALEGTFRRNLERLHAVQELSAVELGRLKPSPDDDGLIEIPKSNLEKFQYPAPILLELIQEYGFNLSQCVEAVQTMEGQSGKQFLSATHRLVVDRENLLVAPVPDGYKEMAIVPGMIEARLGNEALQLKKARQISSDATVAVLDAAKLQYPLLWRSWRPGDYFYPLGMDHRKKLSDFLIDNKISRIKKSDITVIESAGEIAWVVGYRIDNRFKVTPETSSWVSLTYKKK